jgi:ABC-type multidrug transport system fused ATPase/permease subunit
MNATTARKIWDLLTLAERRSAMVLLGLMCVGMVLETLGAGLMIPAITLLTQSDFARNYPALQPALHALGNPSEQTLVIGGMLALVGVYLTKTLLLAVLARRQTRVAFGVQAHLSQRLFTVYLRQPYTFRFIRVFRGYPGLPTSPPPTEGEGAGGGAFGAIDSQCHHRGGHIHVQRNPAGHHVAR